MVRTNSHRKNSRDGISTLADSDEITPLLEAQRSGYVTFPDSDEEWKRPASFWFIELALWANVFLAGFDSTITASTYAAISSELKASNQAAWLTTSYLITSTAFQPLYGRFSDMFGRRICFFISTLTFMAGCLGCSVAHDMWTLVFMRGLTGFGGGGLITMATVINSDLIPFRQRGMYQAMQNILVGFGAVLGSGIGGILLERMNWRWCFGLQVPVSILALVTGWIVLENPEHTIMELDPKSRFRSALNKLDVSGSLLLVTGLVFQLVGLSCGGNEYAWESKAVVSTVLVSIALLAGFAVVEAKTRAIPMIPLRMLGEFQPIAVQATNVFVGFSSYAFMFMIPLYFQAVRSDSPSAAGLRLIVPSLATPVGGVIAGWMMQRGYRLCCNVRIGTALMLLGNLLAMSMGRSGSRWKEFFYLVPANLGLGITNPSCLFSFVSLFDHTDQAVATSTVYLLRSLGSIYGVTVTAAIVQNVLKTGLPAVLGEDATELIEILRKSVSAINDLPAEQQVAVRGLYAHAVRVSFAASSAFALLAFAFSWAHRTSSMTREVK
ncbi:major facilitator superfamily domain-containing protein [Rhypophila decipiens]|uniref:Major facilitator superfamily domain-containing protein n=1 Tax=Rhypophila decipiens TaxID=261697 RepID=A0AAN6YD63_9PEZI|nr:major facilitator superfamily domain-containing protein [Rhypophila decipiens]